MKLILLFSIFAFGFASFLYAVPISENISPRSKQAGPMNADESLVKVEIETEKSGAGNAASAAGRAASRAKSSNSKTHRQRVTTSEDGSDAETASTFGNTAKKVNAAKLGAAFEDEQQTFEDPLFNLDALKDTKAQAQSMPQFDPVELMRSLANEALKLLTEVEAGGSSLSLGEAEQVFAQGIADLISLFPKNAMQGGNTQKRKIMTDALGGLSKVLTQTVAELRQLHDRNAPSAIRLLKAFQTFVDTSAKAMTAMNRLNAMANAENKHKVHKSKLQENLEEE